MEVVKETKEFTIVKKRSGRFGVRTTRGKWINGDEKLKILVEAGVVKAAMPKPAEPEAQEPEAAVAAEGAEAADSGDSGAETEAAAEGEKEA